jgi:thiamine transport system permease protein
MSASLLVFLYSFTSFAVVLVLGGGPASTTLAVEIYRHARIFLNYHNAGALALMETLIAVSAFMAYAYFGRKSREVTTDLQSKAIDYGRSHGFSVSSLGMGLYGLLALLFVLGPVVSLILESFLHQPSRASAQVLTTRWWVGLGDTYLPALLRSLLLSVSSATLACILAVFAAGFVRLSSGKRSSVSVFFLSFVSASPVISSGIVLGLGWLIAYGRAFAHAPIALVLLHAVVALPFAFNSISEGFRSLPANTLNAALIFGSGPFRALFTIALPLSLKRLRSAWGFAAALSLGELNAVMMLGIQDFETLPLFIYRAVGAYRYGVASAAGTLLILLCAGGFILSDTGVGPATPPTP